MKEFDQILKDATKAVADSYFRLPIADGDAVFRERVYCYELYHQMRSIWPRKCEYVLNGEVDKRNHKLLESLSIPTKIPDFIVHIPGTMRNYAIVEMKCNQTRDGQKKDLDTIYHFVGKAKYERGILIYFGNNPNHNLVEKVKVSAIDLKVKAPEIWWHSKVGEPAERLL